MIRLTALCLILGTAVPALAGEGGQPKDVADYVARRDLCDHFRGEDMEGDADRRRFVIKQLDKYCPGSDAALARLKRKYAKDAKVMRRLGDYEEQIEPNPALLR